MTQIPSQSVSPAVPPTRWNRFWIKTKKILKTARQLLAIVLIPLPLIGAYFPDSFIATNAARATINTTLEVLGAAPSFIEAIPLDDSTSVTPR